MLIKDYYEILSIAQGETATLFEVRLNPNCAVYAGHFPGTPVSPGVCNIQMVKECAEKVAGKVLLLSGIKQCRLTMLITPQEHPLLTVSIALNEKDEAYQLSATISHADADCLELKAELTAMPDRHT